MDRIGGERVMEVGLDSSPPSGSPDDPGYDSRQDAYERKLWFKFLSDKCDRFHANVRALLNNRSGVLSVRDPTGIHNLHRVVAESDCDFGDHLDQEEVDRSGNIETGISYYQYATQFQVDLSLLFDTMRYKGFDLRHHGGVLDPDLFVLPDSLLEDQRLIHRLSIPPFDDPARPRPFVVPSTGAYSVQVNQSYNNLPNGAVAELVVVPVAGDLIVSMVAYADRVNPNPPKGCGSSVDVRDDG